MRIEHVRQRPVIDPDAVVAPTAVICGDVHIGAGTVVLAGAVITSQGAPVRIGRQCIVMEQAVVRAAGTIAKICAGYARSLQTHGDDQILVE